MGQIVGTTVSAATQPAVNTPAQQPQQPQQSLPTYQPATSGLLGMNASQSPIFAPRRQMYPMFGGFQQPQSFQQPQGFQPYQPQGFMPYQQPMMMPQPVRATTNAGKGSTGFSSSNMQPIPPIQLVPTQSSRMISK